MSDTASFPTIVDAPCWKLTGVDLCGFLREVCTLVPSDSILGLTSGGAVAVETFMASVPARYRNEPATRRFLIFSTPATFYVPVTPDNIETLADLSEHYAEPEVADVIRIYAHDELILSWHDLPDDPIYVSEQVLETAVMDFCRLLNCDYVAERP